MSEIEQAARVCEQLALAEARTARQNRNQRKTFLIRRRALLDAAAAIRALQPEKEKTDVHT